MQAEWYFYRYFFQFEIERKHIQQMKTMPGVILYFSA
jgi:hypothetical protein